MSLYVISDLHFGHENMAIHRGFGSSENHDSHIVKQWNSIICKKDTVWILGDITMEKRNYEILNRLNGIKKVVLGNHDMPNHAKTMLEYVNGVCGVFKYKNAWLTHIPIHQTELIGNEINIHGHVHDNVKIWDSRYKNVSCCQIGYKPILIDSLL